jgi:hypothetical protein
MKAKEARMGAILDRIAPREDRMEEKEARMAA